MKLLFFIFLLIYSFNLQSDESKIISSLLKVLPEGMSVQSIKKSQIENLYIVDIGDLQPLYVSKMENSFFTESYMQSMESIRKHYKDNDQTKKDS